MRELIHPFLLSKRVGDVHVVPGVVVYMCMYLYLWFHLTLHAWIGWVGEIEFELTAAAGGAFTR